MNLISIDFSHTYNINFTAALSILIMPTPKKCVSKIWEHCTKIPEINGKNVECNICKHKFSYVTSTANIWTHLQNKHGIEEGMYFKSAKGGEVRAQDAVNKMWKAAKKTKYAKDSQKYEDITHALIKFIIQEYLPLRKIESPAFQLYSSMLNSR